MAKEKNKEGTKISKKDTPTKKKVNIFKKIGNFFKDSISEVKKIVWPAPRAVFKNMGIVLAVIIIIGGFVFLLDTGLIALLGEFMGVAA